MRNAPADQQAQLPVIFGAEMPELKRLSKIVESALGREDRKYLDVVMNVRSRTGIAYEAPGPRRVDEVPEIARADMTASPIILPEHCAQEAQEAVTEHANMEAESDMSEAEMAGEASVEPPSNKRLKMSEVFLAAVTSYNEHFNTHVTMRDILARDKVGYIAAPRHLAAYAAFTLLPSTYATFPQVGKALHRDHSTIVHSVRKISALVQAHDPDIVTMLQKIVQSTAITDKQADAMMSGDLTRRFKFWSDILEMETPEISDAAPPVTDPASSQILAAP